MLHRNSSGTEQREDSGQPAEMGSSSGDNNVQRHILHLHIQIHPTHTSDCGVKSVLLYKKMCHYIVCVLNLIYILNEKLIEVISNMLTNLFQ